MGTLRIIGGILKGRTIKFPDIKGLRPIESIMRKSLFDILSSFPKKNIFIDLFSGSGIVGFEALSRGYNKVIFVENNRGLAESIKINAHKFGMINNIDVIFRSIPNVFNNKEVFSTDDIIFLDPPYKSDIIEDTINKMLSAGIIGKETFIVVKHSRTKNINIKELNIIKVRGFSSSVISIMKLK
ncbi:MAG: 16S rRNA (guanine(966)-N(2))-methyltransferase RsmD [bacterium]